MAHGLHYWEEASVLQTVPGLRNLHGPYIVRWEKEQLSGGQGNSIEVKALPHSLIIGTPYDSPSIAKNTS